MDPKMFVKLIIAISIFVFVPLVGTAQNAASRTQPLTAGMIAPDFKLRDQNGETVELSKIKQTTLLVFYRGYW